MVMKAVLKRILATFLVGLIVLALAIVLVRGLGKEDTWTCNDGEWVRHGNPSSEMPTKECKDAWYN